MSRNQVNDDSKNNIDLKLIEADLESKSTSERYSHDEVFTFLRSRISQKIADEL